MAASRALGFALAASLAGSLVAAHAHATPAAPSTTAASPTTASPAAASPTAASPTTATTTIAATPHLDDEHAAADAAAEVAPAADPHDPRAALAAELRAEAETIERAATTIATKLAAADAARAARVRAAYRLLRAPTPAADAHAAAAAAADAGAADARRRGAVHLLLARDAAERALLADEATRLRAARDRTAAEAAQLPSLALPTTLAWPAKGTIARHAGTLEHEKSRATLARRGIDIDVDDHAPVSSPAAGIVKYAGPIRGLDNGIVLDCGGYTVVLGKLGDLAIPVGATLAPGDRIGRAARHRVYLELRLSLGPGGLPMDPEPLLEPR
ncbi:MAG TPA: M23 family metallopeptidase [Kofleriaceae bacterium]